MRHVSVFLLKQFVESAGPLDQVDAAHVSGCPECSASLKRLATRELRSRGVEATLPAAPDSRSAALAAFMAVAAALAVLINNHPLARPTRHDLAASVVAPEGVHGVPQTDPLFSHRPAALADGGARLGSE